MRKTSKDRPPFIFGKNPCCNRRPERAPHIGEFCFPFCWRCCGGLFGMFVTAVLHQTGIVQVEFSLETVVLCFLLFLPAFFHYLSNKVWGRNTKNHMRFLTGIMLGISIEIPVLCFLNMVFYRI